MDEIQEKIFGILSILRKLSNQDHLQNKINRHFYTSIIILGIWTFINTFVIALMLLFN